MAGFETAVEFRTRAMKTAIGAADLDSIQSGDAEDNDMHTTLLNSLHALPLLLGTATAPETPSQPETGLPAFEYRVAAPAPMRHYSQRSRVRLEVFVQDVELGELDREPDNAPNTTLKDVGRERAGFRAAFGKPAVRGYFQLFGEEWDNGFSSTNEFEMFGIGGGVLGEPAVAELSQDDVRLVIPYRAGFNVAWGDDDSGVVDEETVYVEFEGEVGFGAYLWGLRPMVGVYASNLAGYTDIETPGNDFGVDYDGINVGGFAELRYRHDDFPLFAAARVQGGDVEGFVLSFGASF